MLPRETQTTNLALLRVCSILLIVNGLNGVAGLLWRLFTTGIDEARMFFVLLPFITALVGIIAFVRKSSVSLKIYALLIILMLVQQIMGATIMPHSTTAHLDPVDIAKKLTNALLSFKTIFVVAVFLVDSRKSASPGKDSRLNVGLLRFCAAFFIVRGLNEIVNASYDMSAMEMSNLEEAFCWLAIVLGGISIVAGVLSLVLKKSLVLKIYAVFAVLQLLWHLVQYTPSVEMLISVFLNPLFVAVYGTFLIETKAPREA